MAQYELHEYCRALPEMSAEQYAVLCESIRTNGLREEITLYEGKILDGRHRYAACLKEGIEPRFREFDGSDALKEVVIKNLHRRHLEKFQRAMAGSKLLEIERERAEKRQQATLKKGDSIPSLPRGRDGESGEATEKVGQQLGIGGRTVARAARVRERGSPELIEAAESGKIMGKEAEQIAKLNPASQKRIVAIVDGKERKKALVSTLRNSASKKKLHEVKSANGAPEAPGTPFTRQFLGGLELVAEKLESEFDLKTAEQFSDRFMTEFDWTDPRLSKQLARLGPLFGGISNVCDLIVARKATDSGMASMKKAV